MTEYEYLIAPKAFAVDCILSGMRLTAKGFYLREQSDKPMMVKLYDGDHNYVATVLIPPHTPSKNYNLNLNLCL